MSRVVSELIDPNTNTRVAKPDDPNPPEDLTWLIDAKNNIFWMGPIPVFYHPRFRGNADDLEPPIRAFIFRTNNYFGQQFLADFNGFRILGIKKPKWIDSWNLDIDYLSARGLAVAALTRYSSAAALAASVVAPVIAFALDQSAVAVVFGALAVLLWINHLSNIERLTRGRESRIGSKRS